LSRAFFAECVRPIVAAEFPRIAYSAALIGPGSDVLGLDSVRSTDHDWGPRLQIFLTREDAARFAAALTEILARGLPRAFRGYPTHFGPPDGGGIRMMTPVENGPVGHRVEIHALGDFLEARLGFDPRAPITRRDWLATPSQRLLEITAGAVFLDRLAQLETLRATLAWYPHDLWLYLIAAQWQRISEEEAFTGRCDEAGDSLGAAIIAARLVRDLIRLCFLLERRYAPYSKWLGSAFIRLPCAASLAPTLHAVLSAADAHEREQSLARAYASVAALHNARAITPPVDPSPRQFHGRPYRVLHAERFADATRAAIHDAEVLALPPTGAVDQFADSTTVLTRPARWRRLAALFEGPRADRM